MARTSLKMAADEQMDQQMMNAPMKISDASSMFRRNIPKNEPPYEAEIKRLNNQRVDEWYERVLVKIADKSAMVPAGRIQGCISYFLEGKEAISHQKYKDRLANYPAEQVMFWIDFFKNSSMKDLYDAGSGVVSTAWYMIKGAIRNHFAEEKFRVVYSQSDDPLVWDKLANEHPHVMNGRPLPFGLSSSDLNDISTKVVAFLQNPIEPR